MKFTSDVKAQIEAIEEGARRVLDLLLPRDATLATAESLTAGLVGSEIAAIPGASRVYVGGAIVYTDEEKVRQCGVSDFVLDHHSAVSAQAAKQMAEGIRKRTRATYAISTTGYAGPGGGTSQDPVGTFYIGIATPDNSYAEKCYHPGDRNAVRLFATEMAFRKLVKYLTS